MARNTGRGSRIGAQRKPYDPSLPLWQRRSSTSGRFLWAKAHGGDFRSVRPPTIRGRVARWLRSFWR